MTSKSAMLLAFTRIRRFLRSLRFFVQSDIEEKKRGGSKEKIPEVDRDEFLAGQGGTGEGSAEYRGLTSKPLRRIF